MYDRSSTNEAAALGAGLVTVVAWGSAFVAIRAAGESLSPGAIALGRLLVCSAILGAVAIVRREPLPPRPDLLRVAAFGVLWLGVYSVSLNAAERRIDAGTAAMLINTGPLLITVLAGVFLAEGFPRGLLAGCAIAFTGCVLIAVATTGSGAHGSLGLALCVVAALSYASAVVVQKTALRRMSAFQVTWLGCLAATIVCLPFAPALASEAAGAGAGALAWVLYLGIVPTAVGFATWGFALRRTSAGRTAALNYLIPVVAIVLGWAALGQHPAGLALAGGAFCLAGVGVARRGSGRPRARSPQDQL
jgi:drug/metabolite transporter (DMT)-like permease